MNLQVTPKLLIQYLLDETSKGLLVFLNSEINRFPAAIKRDILNSIPRTHVCQNSEGIQINSSCDVYTLLGIFWRNWDILENKVIDPADVEILGRVYRSYISILIQARNEWAHTNSFTYEDVIFYGLTAKRFFSNQKTNSVASVLEEIVEESFLKLIPEKPVEVPISVVPVTPDDKAVESKNLEIHEMPHSEAIKRLKKDDHEKVVDVLLDIVRNKKYEDLAKLVDYPLEITLPDPKFPNTFCLSDERNTFAFGVSKYELINDYLIFVSVFAITGRTIPAMAGEFKGSPTLCLPSNSETNLQIGQVKAQMICMKMREITEWLTKI